MCSRTFSKFVKYCLLLIQVVYLAFATDVTKTSDVIDSTLDGLRIYIPVLMCHAKYTDYSRVTWYKDGLMVKDGGAEQNDHLLSLAILLPDRERKGLFDNPLQLQGYYWCSTDYQNATEDHKYLFKIAEVSTYVGSFVSINDNISTSGNIVNSIEQKIADYEVEMQDKLFSFLPKPSTHVIDVLLMDKGVEIHFYLYVRQIFHPRQRAINILISDQQVLQDIIDYFHNRTRIDDEMAYRKMVDWAMTKGIDPREIELKSTLGCYIKSTMAMTSPNSRRRVNWPYAFIGEVVIPLEECASSSGIAVTRMCEGSFTNGARWGEPTAKCDMLENPLTSQLRELNQDVNNVSKSPLLRNLKILTVDPSELTVTDLHIILSILLRLSKIEKLKQEELDGIITVIDTVVDVNTTQIQSAKYIIKFTERILDVVDNLLKEATSKNQDVSITKHHILFEVKSNPGQISDENAVGFSIHSDNVECAITCTSLENATVAIIENNSSIINDSIAYFILPPEAINRDTKSLIMVLYSDIELFPRPKYITNSYSLLASPILQVSTSDGPMWNLEDPIKLYFKTNPKLKNPVCVYYDPQHENGWNKDGCHFAGIENNFYVCHCHHLSTFAVVAEPKTFHKSMTFPWNSPRYKMGVAAYVGCGLSIIALSFVVILYILSKHWRSSVDQSILFWICLTLLFCMILLLISEMKFKSQTSCIVLSLLMYYAITVTFGWLLVQALVHKLRFGKKSDIEEIPHFLLKAAVCALGVPILIMVIIWITRKDRIFNRIETCFEFVAAFYKPATIPVLILCFFTMFLNFCALYSVSCRFKKDFLIGDGLYNASVLKFRAAFVIFQLLLFSWMVWFWSYSVAFAILITITSYSFAFLFVLHENTCWENLFRKNKKQEKPEESPSVQFVAEKTVEEEPEK